MKLLIVESPTKAKHIQEFLGSGWQVKASLGHIRDLARTGEASYVRPPDFRMNYEVTDDKHKEIVAGLKSAASRADGVYLATDPDREGEAIAWHLAQVLGIKAATAHRVTYQEVTEAAVLKAVANPRNLNMTLVAAQETRRALDRIVGWEVSPPLSRSLNTKASAGRVQTPALRLIVEREREIRKFKSTTWYQVQAVMPGVDGTWRATWQDGLPAASLPDGEYFQDKPFADALAAALPSMPLTVTAAENKPARQAPPPPFTTSSLQMDASRALKIDADQVMKLAQALFEKGMITYHRTDSPNLSQEGEELLRGEAQRRNWPLSEKPRRWKAKGDAQEAHEAIRPTDPSDLGAQLDAQEKALYGLIWKRAMASQLADATYQVTTATLDGGTFQNRPAIFKATGRVLTSQGWRRLYTESGDGDEGEEKDPEASNPVPVLTKGAKLNADRGEAVEKKTQPPKRFTQATLIAELERHGVGRPSTYASIIKVLFFRKYIEQKKQALVPTDLGERAINALLSFHFCDVDYTREIEETLDRIAQGQAKGRELLTKAYSDLQETLGAMPAGAAPETTPCPVEGCDGTVRRLESRKKPGAHFWACTNREAHGLLQDADGQPGKPFEARQAKAPEAPGPDCPKCKQATGRFTTSTGKPYYRCPKCSTAWWPDKGDAAELGEKWKATGGKGGKRK